MFWRESGKGSEGSEGSDIVGSRIVRVGRVGSFLLLVGRGHSKNGGVKRMIGSSKVCTVRSRSGKKKSHDNSKYILRLKVEGE